MAGPTISTVAKEEVICLMSDMSIINKEDIETIKRKGYSLSSFIKAQIIEFQEKEKDSLGRRTNEHRQATNKGDSR